MKLLVLPNGVEEESLLDRDAERKTMAADWRAARGKRRRAKRAAESLYQACCAR